MVDTPSFIHVPRVGNLPENKPDIPVIWGSFRFSEAHFRIEYKIEMLVFTRSIHAEGASYKLRRNCTTNRLITPFSRINLKVSTGRFTIGGI